MVVKKSVNGNGAVLAFEEIDEIEAFCQEAANLVGDGFRQVFMVENATLKVRTLWEGEDASHNPGVDFTIIGFARDPRKDSPF